MTLPNKVILWGTDDVNTLGVVRELGEHSIDFLFLVRGKARFAVLSKYVKELKVVKNNDEALSFLLSVHSQYKVKPIIISTGDGVSVYIDQHSKELEGFFILPTSNTPGLVEKYTDKNNMTALAESLGILCPKSRFVKWNTSVEDVEYPCLIKPSHQKPGHYNEFKYKICHTRKELTSTLAHVRHDSEFILQEYIKSENDLVIFGVRLKDKTTIFAGAIQGDHRACGICSHGYISKTIPSSIDVEKLKEMLDRIDYVGPFGFDFGMVDGKAYFFEVNLRVDGTCHCFYQAGAELLLTYIYDCAGRSYNHLKTIPRDCWFIDEVHDFENVIEGNISYGEWKKAHKEAEIYRYFKEDDTAPWIYVQKRKWIEIFKYAILNKYRLQVVAILDKLGLKK